MDLFDEIIDLLPDQVNAAITTNGRGELPGSFNVQRVANSHGYKMNTTAVDASLQNRIVEHPHHTLKERMRCMLYSVRLGTKFWADTITHTTWLYNRTYQGAIKMTPIQAYTGRYQH